MNRSTAHPRNRSRAALCAILTLALPGTAAAASYSFSAQSMIIPMDMCYQPAAGLGATPKAGYCPDGNETGDDGMVKSYGLVYRLLQQGISVYYVLGPTKKSIDDIDFTIKASAGTPVAMFDRTIPGGGTKEFLTAGHTSLSYRGAPFIVDAADYAKMVKFLAADAALAKPIFKNVNVHVAKQGFLAPVSALLNTVPPKIALLNIGGAAIGVLEGYLKDAGLYTGTAIAAYPAIGDVFTEFKNVTDFTTSNGLVAGGFQILWAPHFEGKTLGGSDLKGVMTAISNFVDAGHPLFAECAAIATFEGANAATSYGDSAAAAPGNFMTSVPGNKTGLATNALPQPAWPGVIAGEGIAFTAEALASSTAQVGDFSFVQTGNSSTFDFIPDTTNGAAYRTGVVRLATSTAPGSEAKYQNKDVLTVMHKDNDPKKGLIVYLGGHSYGSQTSSCNPTCTTSTQTPMVAGERLVLNSMVFLGQVPTNLEIARSSPVLAADNTSYQGTFLEQSGANAKYPPWTGHFREYPPYVSSGTGTLFNQIKMNWDAANGIPAAGSRTVFTAVSVSGHLKQTTFNTANATALATPMGLTGSPLTTAIDGIRGGGLGGIDHSTPAIVTPSSVAGSPTRPTVAYVGALDGMLHAIAVSGSGVVPGTELWAFIPPSQLPLIAGYGAGVDGSPAVSDAFVDLGGTGLKSWHTLLAIPNGAFGGTVDVLDVTDPQNPAYLWTATSPGTSYAMGAANGATFATISDGLKPRTVLLMATNNAGNGGNGFNLYALDAGNGGVVWQWNHLYTRHIPSTVTLVPNDIPGVPTTADTTGDGSVADRVYFGDLDGRIWEVVAGTGTAPGSALYDAGADGYPFAASVSQFRDATSNDLSIVGVTSGADWVPSTIAAFTVAVDAQHHVSGSTGPGVVAWKTVLSAGERVYGAPTVAGGDVYLMSSFGNLRGDVGPTVTDAGNLRRLSLGNGAITFTSAVGKGASEVAVGNDGTLVAASVGGENIITNPGRNPVGPALESKYRPATIWAWLDFG